MTDVCNGHDWSINWFNKSSKIEVFNAKYNIIIPWKGDNPGCPKHKNKEDNSLLTIPNINKIQRR